MYQKTHNNHCGGGFFFLPSFFTAFFFFKIVFFLFNMKKTVKKCKYNTQVLYLFLKLFSTLCSSKR